MSQRLSFLIAAALLAAHAVQAQVPPAGGDGAMPPPTAAGKGAPPPSPPSGHGTKAPRPPRSMAAADATVVNGRVLQWLLNPNGEADGFLLADGTQVAFPPHLSASMTAAFKVGDTVRVTGWRAPGVPVMRLQSVSANGHNVINQPPARGDRPAPRRAKESGALDALSANGRIERLLYNDRGDVHGVVLTDKTIVRFPPHVGGSFASQMRAGSTLSAIGWGTRVAQGTALEATRLGATPDTLTDVFGAAPAP